MLFNGEFVNRQAKFLADRLEKEAGADATNQITLAYRLALCRPPTAAETETLLTYLQKHAENQRAAREQMCRVIFNLNEFVYPD